MAKPAPLPLSRLHATLDPARIPWKNSNEIPVPRHIKTGRSPFQPRAMQALDMALEIRAQGYHVYLSGEQRLGRKHMLQNYLEPIAKQANTPPDLVHIHNFSDPDMPLMLAVPPGTGKKLRLAMEDFIAQLPQELQKRLENEDFIRQRAKLMEQFQDIRSSLLAKMNEMALEKGFNLEMDNEGGVALSPMRNGKKLSDEDFGSLEPALRLEFRNRGNYLTKSLSGFMRELNKAEEALRENERLLEKEVMAIAVDALLGPLSKKFLKSCSSDALKSYFKALGADIIKNTEVFLPADSRKEESHNEIALNKYAVNVFVDNSHTRGAPVIIEDHPTAMNLLGCLERESEMGALVTDVTLIRSGSLQAANGGYLIIHAEDLLQHPAAWEGLLRSLRANQARIEEWGEAQESGFRAKSLRPQPLELSLKVILIGSEEIYEHLLEHDDRFVKLFRIKAHMNDITDRTSANIKLYLGNLAAMIRSAGLMPFDASALAWLVDLGSRISEDQKKLSLKFPLLQELMIEANAIAEMAGKGEVSSRLLEKAYSQRTWRANLIEESFMEDYNRSMIRLSTSGMAIGQVNGLSVTWQGDYEFGLPHRISCTVGVGHDGLMDIEREAELGGPIHTKAMMILKSYILSLFASKKPLVFSASLYFEQSYGGIEGDSASGAELAALISALAGVPARLDLAFTGAVSHSGQILAVGGVTKKIEGFFKVCMARGLTGTQGVIIPADNLDHLTLSPEILENVASKRFSVYAVRTIDEALHLLTGLPVGKRRKDGTFTPKSLYDLVDRRLESLGYNAQNAFRKNRKEH